MLRIATCSVAFREVATFEEFAAHLREILDAASGADLVVLPELVTWELMTAVDGWTDATDLAPALETVAAADRYRDLIAAESARRRQYVLGGSHLVPSGAGIRNVATLHGPDGTLVHEHAKSHLFPLEHTLGIVEGDAMDVVELPFARVGVNICYEAEIPECAAALAQQGAEIVLSPSLTLTEAGFWRVRHCLAARAIENQIYAVHSGASSAARGPWPGAWARSSVVGPCDAGWPDDGVLAETAANVDAVAMADLDLDHLADNRKHGAATTYADRRRRAERYRSWPSHVGGPRA